MYICLNFTAILVEFSEKTSTIKTKCLHKKYKTAPSIFTKMYKSGENRGGCFGLKWLNPRLFSTDSENLCIN